MEYCTNINPGGGCGGPGLDRVVVGAFLGGYIILYGQVQSWTPQLVTGPLNQTPPNKMTEVCWGMINCYPSLIVTIVIYASEAFHDYHLNSMNAASQDAVPRNSSTAFSNLIFSVNISLIILNSSRVIQPCCFFFLSVVE